MGERSESERGSPTMGTEGEPDMVLTALAVGLAFLAPAAVLGAVFALPRWVALAGEARRRRLRNRGVLVAPAGRPLERIAADLRRLSPQRVDSRRSRVQREAARLAYEDVLREAARALGIDHDLVGAPTRLAREFEAIRVEQALHDAGMMLSA